MDHSRANRAMQLGAMLCLTALFAGCAQYQTPGAGADFQAIGLTEAEVRTQSDRSILRRIDRQPLASFPATVAVARIQGRGYSSMSARGYGYGRFSLVTTRDVETDEAFDRLVNLPLVRGVAPLNRLVVPERLDDERQLRQAAADVQADLLLIYTFDTLFGTESRFAPLSVITLGLFPEKEARVTSTASAALIDTRNGYIYGLAEATSERTQGANAWTSRDAVDQSRRAAEREAFERLVGEVETLWRQVAQRFEPDADAADRGGVRVAPAASASN